LTTLSGERPSHSISVQQRRLAPAIRTTWTQHRSALISFAVFSAVVAIVIVVSQISTHADYASYVNHGCVARPINHVPCGVLDNNLQNMNTVFTGLLIVLGVFPILVGAFVGAPLLARELETGTFRFTWTQEIGRVRYFLTTFVTFSCIFALIAVTIGFLFGNWYAHPFEVTGADSHWQAGLFETTGSLLAAWALFALACGCFVGALIRRIVASIAATTVIVGGLLVGALEALPRLLRFWTLSSSKFLVGGGALQRGPKGGWVVGGYLTGPNGQALSDGTQRRLLAQALSSIKSNIGATRWLSLHGYKFWTTYQPSSHFWVFQSVEALVILAASALLVRGTVRRISRAD
jgi:hypothetical protein